MLTTNSIKLINRPDYSYNAFLPLLHIKNIYNTILIPYNININFINNSKIAIKNKNQKFYQTIVLDQKIITINNVSYTAIHIAPGLQNINTNDTYTLEYQNQNIPMDLFLDINNNHCKLIIGLIILNNNYYENFNNSDKIQLIINNYSYIGYLIKKIQKYNFYYGEKTVTILDIIDNINSDIIYNLNKSTIINTNNFIRSLDTKYINQKGSVSIKIKENIVFDTICEGIDNNYKSMINNKQHYAQFNDLNKGKYKLTILVDNNEIYNTILSIEAAKHTSHSKL